jgi:SET domain-containing protein
MLLVKTKVGPSSIEGTGLFAGEFIAKGTPIWKFSPDVDEAFTPQEAEALPEPKRSEILSLQYTYLSKQTGRYISPGDDARFINHSGTPNIATIMPGEVEDEGVAARDVQRGEELTVDYRAFAKEGTNFKSI